MIVSAIFSVIVMAKPRTKPFSPRLGTGFAFDWDFGLVVHEDFVENDRSLEPTSEVTTDAVEVRIGVDAITHIGGDGEVSLIHILKVLNVGGIDSDENASLFLKVIQVNSTIDGVAGGVVGAGVGHGSIVPVGFVLVKR